MAEFVAETQDLESTTVAIYRTSAVIKGGRRFSFGALVVVGDRNGRVGLGYGKAPGVPAAIEKAQKEARKKLVNINLEGGTIPHPITANFSSSKVRLIPAAPGTGVIAGGTVRAVLELAGVRDCLTKAYGSTNNKNLCKAAMEGLLGLRTKDSVTRMRGVEVGKTEVEERLELGARFAPAVRSTSKPKAAESDEGDSKKGGKGKGKGKGKSDARSKGSGGGGVVVTAKQQPKPKPEQKTEEKAAEGEGEEKAEETKAEGEAPQAEAPQQEAPKAEAAESEAPKTEGDAKAEGDTKPEGEEAKADEGEENKS